MKLWKVGSWYWILRDIERGEWPDNKLIVAALERGEPLSPQQQRVLAKLFDGSVKRVRRGPRKKYGSLFDAWVARTAKDYDTWRDVMDLMDKGSSESDALEQVRKRRRVDGPTLRREYLRARKIYAT